MAQTSLLVAVIEDNTDLNGILVNALRAAGHAAEGHASVEGFEAAGTRPDIFLLDLNLPGEDGISFARRLRAAQSAAGIVMLTARNEMEQRKNGYDSGADIYLTKPSSVDEILGAVNALARRIAGSAVPPGERDADALVLAPRRLEISGPSGTVSISAAEAAFLSHCATDPEARISFDALRALTPDGAEMSKVALELKAVRLRKKLAAAGFDGRSIGSVRNYGYQLLVAIRLHQG